MSTTQKKTRQVEDVAVKRDFSRQEDLVPRNMISGPISIIGCGAIGRNVAIQLAQIGVPEIQIIDFDSVEQTNVTTQGFRQDEIGLAKVEALAAEIKRIDPNIKVDIINDRWRPKYELGTTVFFCVDKIEVRGIIWKHCDSDTLVIDGRMLGLNISIITCMGKDKYYDSTLFDQSEAEPGRCTARSTIYSSQTAASFMVQQFTASLRRLPIHKRIDMSLNTWDFDVSDESFIYGQVDVQDDITKEE